MRKKSSRRWLKEHFDDPYVKKAHHEGLRSRAVYKLKEIQERDRLVKPGMTVIDLGASPGGWSQLLVKWVGKHGKVLALDILPMTPIAGVEFIQGDFNEESIVTILLNKLNETSVDWVFSDIAPNLSGIDSVDQPRSIELAELALDFAISVIKKEGGMLIKVFQGEGFDAFLAKVKLHFKKVAIRKPKASRDRSREVYILARSVRELSRT